MNIDQLKLILETFNAAGEGGKELFLWWLAKGFIGDVGEFILVGGLIIGCYRIARHLLTNYTFTGQVGKIMGDSLPLFDSTIQRALEIIRQNK